MKLGAISEYNYLLDSDEKNQWEFFSFELSREALSYFEIFDSAFSTPARYVQEIFVRLCLREGIGQRSCKFVFNPLYETDKLATILVLNALKQLDSMDCLSVLIDKNDVPVGYIFPSWLNVEDSRFLSLLSTVDGRIDAELLRKMFFVDVQSIRVEYASLNKVLHNQFWYEGNLAIYQWIAETAIAVLKLSVNGENPNVSKRQRDAIPFAAVVPYHAGDVLFFLIAFNNIDSHYSRIVVNKAYQDIVVDNAPTISVVPIEIALVNRDEEFRAGNVTYDYEYFERFRDDLPTDSFYVYHRPSREYNVTKFHLIDHFAFALGERLCSRNALLFKNKIEPHPFTPALPTTPTHVLLHFDGGWPLKVYPIDYQEKLINILYGLGYVVTVLAGEGREHPMCTVTSFKSYKQFTELLRTQHILVGMDSFPAHYATHILGIPTICLFANTRPENSNAPSALNYLFLERDLRCRPCAGIVECPLYGITYCKNFVGPEIVVEALAKLICAAQETQTENNNIVLNKIDSSCCPTKNKGRKKTKHISLRNIRLKVAVASMVHPSISYVLLLHREYFAAVRDEGFIWASLRTFRFLNKVFRNR